MRAMNAATRAAASGSSTAGFRPLPFSTFTTRGTAISTGFAAGFWRFLRDPRLVTIGMSVYR
jgi:hypothetical protein